MWVARMIDRTPPRLADFAGEDKVVSCPRTCDRLDGLEKQTQNLVESKHAKHGYFCLLSSCSL